MLETVSIKNDITLNAIVDSLMANIAVLDQQGNIIFVNNNWNKFWQQNDGVDPNRDWIGVNYLETINSDSDKKTQQISKFIYSVINGEMPAYRVEYPCHSPDQKRWFLMSVSPLDGIEHTVVVTHIDITERKLIEQELTLNQERLKRSHTFASIGTWEWDITTNQLNLSEGTEPLFGFKEGESVRELQNLISAVHPADIDKVEHAIGKCFEELHYFNITHRVLLPDSEIRWLHQSGDLVFGEDGEPQIMRGVVQDITQRKELEHKLIADKDEQHKLIIKLQEAQQQLLQSEKLASIGQLAAGVAHEINNPVGYINSNIGSLKQYINELLALIEVYEQAESSITDSKMVQAVTTAKQKADLDFLKEDLSSLLQESEEGVSRVKQIVQDLKDFSHVDEAEWQWADLQHGIDSTLNIVWNELKYKAEVVKEYGDIPDIECIPSQLNQVFMNLLVNAAHAIEERGTITIRTGQEGNDNVWVEISDTGSGIPQDKLNKIFEPFFTTKPVGTGTGLGLSLSYGIIEKHGGKITVNSEVGKGTTFKIVLPIELPDDEQNSEGETAQV